MDPEEDILAPWPPYFEGSFYEQVDNLLQYVRLKACDVHMLRGLFDDLEQALQTIVPGLKVKPFGSIVAGLGIKTSDVDCFIELPKKIKPSVKHVIHAKNVLRRRFRIFRNLFAITTAKVPIVKFLHVPTNRNCDINFVSLAGVLNSHLIGHLLHMDRNAEILQLAVLIKYWARVHKITGTNLLANYALTMMVIFYLQQKKILPSIWELQKDVRPYIVDHWNMACNTEIRGNPSNTGEMYQLLKGFFKYYANLNFDQYIISPYLGRLLTKREIQNFDEIPEQFELYKQNILGNLYPKFKTGVPICVQDPFEHARNCTGAIYPKLAAKIKGHIQFAAKTFDEVLPHHVLRIMLTEDPTRMMPKVKNKPRHVSKNKINKRNNNAPQNLLRILKMLKTSPKKPEVIVLDSPQETSSSSDVIIIDAPSTSQNADKVAQISEELSQHSSGSSQNVIIVESPEKSPNPPLNPDNLHQSTEESSKNSNNTIKSIIITDSPQKSPNNAQNTGESSQHSNDIQSIIITDSPQPSLHSPQNVGKSSKNSKDALQSIIITDSPQKSPNPFQNIEESSQSSDNSCQIISSTLSQNVDKPQKNLDEPPLNANDNSQDVIIISESVQQSSSKSENAKKPNERFKPRQPKRRGLQNSSNLKRCFEQIRGIKKSRFTRPRYY